LVAYITKNISFAILDISHPGPVNSSNLISSFTARKDGWGYFNTRKSVPSTTPGSTSSVVLLNSEDIHDDRLEIELVGKEFCICDVGILFVIGDVIILAAGENATAVRLTIVHNAVVVII